MSRKYLRAGALSIPWVCAPSTEWDCYNSLDTTTKRTQRNALAEPRLFISSCAFSLSAFFASRTRGEKPRASISEKYCANEIIPLYESYSPDIGVVAVTPA